MYNKLPERIRKLNLKRFKIEMKDVLTSEAFYSVEEFNAFIPSNGGWGSAAPAVVI